MTVNQLITLLSSFDSEMKVQAYHQGTQTYAPIVFDLCQMYETTDDTVSRGNLDENLSEERGGDYQTPVVLINVGW